MAIDGTTKPAGYTPRLNTIQAVEYALGPFHFTDLILNSFVVGTIPSGASLAFGAQIYNWPDVVSGSARVSVLETFMNIRLSGSGVVQTDTPEVGIGSVVASGAVATLSGTFEDYVDGGAAGGNLFGGQDGAIPTDIASDQFMKGSLTTVKPFIRTGTSPDVFLNVADAWAVNANGTLTCSGRIYIRWIGS